MRKLIKEENKHKCLIEDKVVFLTKAPESKHFVLFSFFFFLLLKWVCDKLSLRVRDVMKEHIIVSNYN